MTSERPGLGRPHWWRGEEEPHLGIYDVLDRLRSTVDERDARWRRYLSIALNKDVSGWRPGSLPSEEQTWRSFISGARRLYLNPSSNCIATLGSRIASQRIRIQYLTSTSGPGAWKLRNRARKLQKAVEGEWYREDVHRKAAQVFADAAMLGMGAMAVFAHEGRVRFERVFPGLLIVDEQACLLRPPRVLYHVDYLPAEVLIERYPKKEREIVDAVGKIRLGGAPGLQLVTDLVETAEAWHLRSGKDANDGKRAFAIEGATLEQGDYARDHFPFALMPWQVPVIGFWPQGLIEQEEPIQGEANKLLRRVQDAMHIYSVAKTYAPQGTLDKAHLKNETGDIVEYMGQIPPRTDMPPSVSSEVFSFLWQLVEQVYKDTGVSQLSASGVKPAGVESSVAMRTLADLETGRHALLSQAWERFFVDVAELTVEACKEIGGYVSRYPAKEGYEEIKWSEIDLDRDAYELQPFPTSYLPHTPAGRLSAVQEMLQAGFVDKSQALLLLQMPDVEQFTSLETAALEDIDRQIGRMLDEGSEERPEPYMDLQVAMARVTSALLRARQDGAPDDRLRLLVQYLTQADRLLNPRPPPTPPGPGPGEMLPPGMPPEMMAGGMPPGMPPEMAGAPPGVEGMPVPIPPPQADLPLAMPAAPLE